MAAPMSPVTLGFLAARGDAASFGHAEHVRAAWDLLQRHDFLAAADRYFRAIMQLAEQAGVPHKANLTITLAFLSLIAERMARQPWQSFAEFAAGNPDLMCKDVLLRWYRPERLYAPMARQQLLLPEPGGALPAGVGADDQPMARGAGGACAAPPATSAAAAISQG